MWKRHVTATITNQARPTGSWGWWKSYMWCKLHHNFSRWATRFCQTNSWEENALPRKNSPKLLQPNPFRGQSSHKAFPSKPYKLMMKWLKPSCFWLKDIKHFHSRVGYDILWGWRLSALTVNFQFRFLTSSHWNLVIFGMLKNLHFHFLMISIKLFLLVIAIALFSKHWLWRIYMYLNIILLSSSLPLTPHLERIILQVKWQSLDSYKTTWTQDCQ